MTLVEVRGVHKRFKNTRALDGIDLTLKSGEILGIAGPNGAGKSTLTRVLSGEETLDFGEIRVDGELLSLSRISELVAVVHQEPQVWLNLTVAQNLMVGNENSKMTPPSISTEQMEILDRIGIANIATMLLADCSLAVRQRVEIARALIRDARVILLDEPNSALTDEESQALFLFMHELAAAGHVVALVTHRLAELVKHCNRVVVIRDGRVAVELTGDQLSESAIAGELVAGKNEEAARRNPTPKSLEQGRTLISTSQWSDGQGSFLDVSLKVSQGEIIAIVGVEGSGGRELVSALGGMRSYSGEIEIAELEFEGDNHIKIAYLSANRTEMLFHNMTVGDNLVVRLKDPKIANRLGWLRKRDIHSQAVDLVSKYSIRADGVEQMLTSLSGGNQQKVAIAAAMAPNPSLLLIEEPTRGVDVGSKREIYQMLRKYADRGPAVIVFCTEAPEAFELADRVMVIQRGVCRDILRPADFPDIFSFANALAKLELIDVAEHYSNKSAVLSPSPSSNEKENLA